MTSRKIKYAAGKRLAATCITASFVMLFIFSSYADEGTAQVIVPEPEAALLAAPAGPGGESQGQEKAATGPGSEPFDASGTPADDGAGAVMTAPVYPIVKEVDKYSYDQMEQDIRAFEALYKERVKVEVLGITLDGRNIYDAAWHLVGPENRPSGAGYKGPNPFSEPESLALAYLLQREQVKACLNYHSMGQVIYWDVACNKQREASLNLARQYSGDSGYRLSGELGLGGVKDWVQIKEPSMPSITVEVGSSAAPVPISQFPAIWQQNHLGPARMMGFVLNY